MPWKESSKMNERAKFVLRLQDGERMADMCREFGISRKTGYKIYNRYKERGFQGLYDEKRGPRRAANKTSASVQALILDLKQEKPSWGAGKIRERLLSCYPHRKIPAKSTIHTLFDQHGLVKKKRRRSKFKASPTYLSTPTEPNALWCTDFKGQFKLQNRQYCYPLTITDQVSRYILGCEAFESICSLDSQVFFEEVFKEYGLPVSIRSDNGEPFSSRSIWGLSALSIWWLRLGIKLERIQPGKPQQNGVHERMHRTLKAESTRPPGKNILQQQEMFDRFRREFNQERPHEGIGMKVPADVYQHSSRPYPAYLKDMDYPDCDIIRRVSKCGRIFLEDRRKIFISTAFKGEWLGIKQIDYDIWKIKWMDYALGYVDNDVNKLSLCESPFIKTVT